MSPNYKFFILYCQVFLFTSVLFLILKINITFWVLLGVLVGLYIVGLILLFVKFIKEKLLKKREKLNKTL
jgi:hypothetical protein